MVVERVSGQRFSDFQQQLIFDPAGMRNSFSIPRPEREATAPYAYGYDRLPDGRFQRIEYDPSVYMYGSGDVVSSMDDLVRFDRAVFAGNVIGLDLLQEALVPVRLNDGTEPTVLFEGQTKYGYGWFISQVGDHPFVGHAGIYLGYRTYFAHFLDEDLHRDRPDGEQLQPVPLHLRHRRAHCRRIRERFRRHRVGVAPPVTFPRDPPRNRQTRPALATLGSARAPAFHCDLPGATVGIVHHQEHQGHCD